MHICLKQLNLVEDQVNKLINQKQLKTNPKIIVVTKTFPLSSITPLIEYGHIHFGENRIQEAENKWPEIKSRYTNLKLHMIGKLQSNKAKKAVMLFDYIHSLDNAKLASKICQYEKELRKKVKLFIQVNVANEKQKSGISISDLNKFYYYCTKELSLNIIGLMCLPPNDSNSDKYFSTLRNSAEKLHLKDLSMGMSSDFEIATLSGSTFLRVGTLIMGERNSI